MTSDVHERICPARPRCRHSSAPIPKRNTAGIVGVISAAATLATTAEGGEGGGGKRFRSPYYVVESPVYVVRPSVAYVAPPPRVVYAPAPVYYDPVYVAPAYPSLNINIPLR